MSLRKLAALLTAGLTATAASMATMAATASPPRPHADSHAAQVALANRIFRAVDTNKDGQLSPQEFAAGYAELQRLAAIESRLHEQFRHLDANHDGVIDGGEYANLTLVRRAGANAPALAVFDADQSGQLDFAEYLAAIRRLSAAPGVKR